MTNLLQDVEGNVTFDQYAISDFWAGGLDADGRATLTASIDTQVGLPYLLEFSMAANLAAEATNVAIQVSYAVRTLARLRTVAQFFQSRRFCSRAPAVRQSLYLPSWIIAKTALKIS